MSRVVVLHPHFTYPGGAGAVALHTAGGLAERGYEVHVVSMQHDPDLVETWPNIRFHQFGGPLTGTFRYWSTVRQQHKHVHNLLAQLEPDVLLAHVFPANYWAFTYRRLVDSPPVIWYCHEPSAFVHDWSVIRGVDFPMQLAVLGANPPLQVFDRLMVRRADIILANSEFTASRVRKVYGRSANVAYPGFDPPAELRPVAREPLMLAVGRLTRFKRFDLVIRAAAELKSRGYVLNWQIVGDGEDRTALERLIANLEVADTVHMLGRVSTESLDDAYRRARAVIVASINEPFGLVPIEAMARGAAVICSDSGGPRETVVNGETGLYARSGDWMDIANQVARLADSPELARELGAAGRNRAIQCFTWERTVDGIASAIGDLVNADPGNRRPT